MRPLTAKTPVSLYPIVAKSVQCGIRGTRIVGGSPAERGEFPSIVSLKVGRNHFCGGTLISEQWVLTAAHCVDDNMVRIISVAVGEHNVSGPEFPSDALIVKPSKIIRHIRYSSATFENDIALIKLRNQIRLENNKFAGVACLPDNNFDTYTGKNAIAAGWGLLQENGVSPSILQKVTLPVISNQKCSWLLRRHFDINSGHICAGLGEGGRDACRGDSGGPLYIGEDDKDYLVGITSFGVGCARPRLPGVWTRTSHYLNWIIQVINTN
ncbi:unnamed protein product [Cyprideis torosa]|uniref:Uncharacterized protein n=1 Tax=Cyprideis torosa TaxID=163714 RepID=A0A7R8WF19_9CRUS|nr:unnamed protein product [Cyprideis torosa]CAG0896324.1 unnamed protein product [Cyprideis torosa]